MSGAGERSTGAGFTLLEMLVTLAILALCAGVAFPALDKAMRWQRFVGAAVTVEGALRAARAEAIRDGTAVRIEPASDGHGLRHAGSMERLADTATVSLPPKGVAFFADGSATGGRVVLLDRDRVRRWSISAATGAIGRVP